MGVVEPLSRVTAAAAGFRADNAVMVPDVPGEPDFVSADVRAWADAQASILEMIATRFVSTGEWPEIATLTRELAREGQVVALSSVLESLPRPLGCLQGYPRRAVLLVFGLALTNAGRPVVEGLIAILGLARERFEGPDPEPLITEADVSDIVGGETTVLHALLDVLQRETPFVQGGTRGANDEWFGNVTEDVVRYWHVREPTDYLRTRMSELFAAGLPGWPASPVELGAPEAEAESSPPDEIRDAFISHAGEDKDTVARPLAQLLEALGHSVWLDEQQLVVGDSLSESIDRGLALSRFGVVVLSRSFFAKSWPKRELEGLVARETIRGEQVILPVWHEVDETHVLKFSPPLAARYAAKTSEGLEVVANKISEAINRRGPGPARPSVPAAGSRLPSPPRTLQEILETADTPPGSPDHWSLYDGAAVLRMVAAPVPTGLRHPAAADPRTLLSDASARAGELAAEWPKGASMLLGELKEGWRPLTPHVWGAGQIFPEPERLRARGAVAASFSTRTGVLAVDRTWPTAVEDGKGGVAFHAAREPEVAAELLVSLRLAAVLLAPLPGIEAVDVAVVFAAAPTNAGLVSSERAVSGRRFGDPVARIVPTADVPPRHVDHDRFAISELLDAYSAARQLLGPWLATFREDEVFERLANG